MLQFTMGIQDAELVNRIEKEVTTQLVDIVGQKVLSAMFQVPVYRSTLDPDIDDLSEAIQTKIAESILQYKDQIIERAVDRLVDTLSRSYDVRKLLQGLDYYSSEVKTCESKSEV